MRKIGCTVLAVFLCLAAFAGQATSDCSTWPCYSGPVDQVFGGLPNSPLTLVDLDHGGTKEFFIGSGGGLVGDSWDSGGAITYMVEDMLYFYGDGEGNITNYSVGDEIDIDEVIPAGPQNLEVDVIGDDWPGYTLTGFDFSSNRPLGAYFSESEPVDVYWGINFVPTGTLGMVIGWLHATINPVTVDRVNETISGGEFILREYAHANGLSTIRVGQIPEPSSQMLMSLAMLLLFPWLKNQVGSQHRPRQAPARRPRP